MTSPIDGNWKNSWPRTVGYHRYFTHRAFKAKRGLRVVWLAMSLSLPAVLGGLITWSWWGALTAFFWATLVRVSFCTHVTWSINSICHMIGDRPFASRDKAANFWPLAILSMGESWHARVIWIFERLGWVSDVRWTNPTRLARIATPPMTGTAKPQSMPHTGAGRSQESDGRRDPLWRAGHPEQSARAVSSFVIRSWLP